MVLATIMIFRILYPIDKPLIRPMGPRTAAFNGRNQTDYYLGAWFIEQNQLSVKLDHKILSSLTI